MKPVIIKRSPQGGIKVIESVYITKDSKGILKEQVFVEYSDAFDVVDIHARVYKMQQRLVDERDDGLTVASWFAQDADRYVWIEKHTLNP